MSEEQTLNQIKELLLKLDKKATISAVELALGQGISARDIIFEALQPGMKQIGEKFSTREYFIPEMMLGAQIVKEASAVLEHSFNNDNTPEKKAKTAKVVVGSAQTDIHDIGKNILGLVLRANGFEVHDIGVDVAPETFLSKAVEVQADVVAISALLSGVVGKISETIAFLRDSGITAKIIVGGAALTQEAADTIGADAYGEDAWNGVQQIIAMVA